MFYDTYRKLKSGDKSAIDIYEHLYLIEQLAHQCDSIVEFGVRWVTSTYALAAGLPKELTSYDLFHPNHWPEWNGGDRLNEVIAFCRDNKINFQFKQENILNIICPETDLLLIDSQHNENQITAELNLHADKVKKFIVFHDTELFATIGESYLGRHERGIADAMAKFLECHSEWSIDYVYKNNNGLTIWKRKYS